MADSDSSLSSPPSTDDEMPVDVPPAKASKPAPQKKKKNGTILSFFDRKSTSPPRKKRPASPPHEYVPEDNPAVAFIVMFRSRFTEAFPPKCPHFGPQDIEQGVAEPLPSSQIEALLCALLGLVLNRKKPVEKGHYGRALEEALQTQKSQWPRSWNYVNPLSGGRTFNSMAASERIDLLKTLVLWSLNQSEIVNAMIKDVYKSRTTKDRLDTHIPLSVQPWGRDGDKRRYWLIEGQDDTSFRVYRESNPQLKNVTWWSVAGTIDELRDLAKKLEEQDGTKEAKALSERMLNAVPRFEATEVKRKRREYRINRNNAFLRPELGYSLYEGRTRGKRQKYTFSEEEDEASDSLSVRRSTRTSGRETSAAPSGPTVTASGRQVRSRATGMYGESLLSGQTTERASPATGDYIRSDASEEPQQPAHGRSTRAANRAGAVNGWAKGRKHIETYNDVDSMDEDDATSWDGGDEDEDDNQMELDDDEDESRENSSDEEHEAQSLVVRLRYPKGSFNPPSKPTPTVSEEDATVPEAPAQHAYSVGAPLAGVGAPRQPEPIPAPAFPAMPAQTFPTTSEVQPTSLPAPRSNISQHEQVNLPPLSAAVPGPPAQGDPTTLPRLDGFFSAPAPPYNVPEEHAQKPPRPQFTVSNSDSHPAQPFTTTLPNPTPTSSWQ